MAERQLLEVTDLVKHFPLGGGLLNKPRSWVKAVDGVSFTRGPRRELWTGRRIRLRKNDSWTAHPALD